MSLADLSDLDLLTGLNQATEAYPDLVNEFVARHGRWIRSRCTQLSWHYWKGDLDFADEVFARFGEKLARRTAFAGLKQPDKWQGFLSVELDHQAQDLGRFLRAARRDRRQGDGTVREVAIEEAPEISATLSAPSLRDQIVSRENVEAVKTVIRDLVKAAADAEGPGAARELYNLQMFVRVILQGAARKDLALEQMTAANRQNGQRPVTLESQRKKVERGVAAGVAAIANALDARGHHELAAAFGSYLQEQTDTRGRAAPVPGSARTSGEVG